jgi:hypothetical protein
MEKGGKSAKQDRQARLAEALRANLQRRKAGRHAARAENAKQPESAQKSERAGD